MGIKGLTNYVLCGDEAAGSWDGDFVLRDTRLVVDGDALQYQLLSVSGPGGGVPDARCGGQYIDYHTRICAFFRDLRQHGVQPLVILDGVSEPEKQDTIVQRCREQAQYLKRVFESELEQQDSIDGHRSVLPLWGRIVFVEALVTCRVAVACADYEADCSIAAVARRYECPVLTGDSDFFICDLPGGVIHFSNLDLQHPCRASSRPILFRRSLFTSALQRTRRLRDFSPAAIENILPLAATLSGNDFVAPGNVRGFYPNGRGSHPLVWALVWLLGDLQVCDMGDGLSTLLDKLPASIHEGVKHSVEMYRPEESIALALVQQCLDVDQLEAPFHFKGNRGGVAGAAASHSQAFSHQPGWLMELFHLGLVAPLPFLRYENSLSRVSLCLESFRHSPVSNIDKPLRSIFLGLICQDKAIVRELVRVPGGASLQSVRLHPCPLEVNGKPLSVANMPSVSVSKRRKVLLRALESGTESIAELDLTLQLPVATLRYLWCHMYDRVPRITLRHLKVLLLGIADACGSVIDTLPCLDHDVIIPAMRSSLSTWSCDDGVSERAEEKVIPVATTDLFCGPLNGTTLHIFNAWQLILKDVLQLNYALRMPFPTPFLHGLYNGVHNHKLFVDEAVEDVFCTSRRQPLAKKLWQALTAELDGLEAATSGAASTAATGSNSKERGKGDKKKREAPSSAGKSSGSGNRFALLGCE